MSKSKNQEKSADALPRLEWIVAGSFTAIAIVFHFVLLFHAGGLWRDEVNTIELAGMPTLKDIWDRKSNFGEKIHLC